MNRLQNTLVGVWVLLILLFAAFNWPRVWEADTVHFLFMEFRLRWLFWVLLLALAVPVVLRWLAWWQGRGRERRSAREIAEIKSRAFDERHADQEKLAERIERSLESVMQRLAGENLPGPPGTRDEPDKPAP